jgi:acetyl-CoA C-acetyltransferase
MSNPVIVSAVRTAVGSFGGGLKSIPATVLGSLVIKETLARIQMVPDTVDQVIMGNVIQAGLGQNPARQAALGAGLPVKVGALTVNKVCGSGLEAIIIAADRIRAGTAEIIVAGGMENMSRAPFLLREARFGYRLGDGKLVDAMICDGLWDAYGDVHMGTLTDELARRHNITRTMQDEFATWSQQKCAAAQNAGRFKDEILPVEVAQPKGPAVIFERDEFPKPDTTVERLAKLKPAFGADGTITAGNASGIGDGAAALVVMSAARAVELGLTPLAEIVSYGAGGVDPSMMGIGPVPATEQALARAGLNLDAIGLVELNEAFAAQSQAVVRALGFRDDRLNVNGGAIALGHPIGASGARIMTTLLHEMAHRKVRHGLATLCIGGGEGLALIVRRS